ncbi:hypothetical protein FRZ40_34185 [Paraburkholderia azotifigens]|uniref:Uncharacterized protein n=1 Tax=Paraburkholderia azotifigens TaxID=2057004 RepID=A0A5C6V2S2_9BURK|nr:hypothetical protein FRZ40_34185 [Paraburkholderia azotifigens]
MGIIRKRLATSREPCSEAQDAQPTEGDSAPPLDERASSAAAPAAPPAPRKKTSKHASDVTRPLVIVRVRSKPRQITHVNETGAPDWSLSAGVAVVLFGFVIAFGTYATLTEREAAQSQLHRFTRHEEPRPAAQHRLPSPALPTIEIADAPRSRAEPPAVPTAASNVAAIDSKADRAASAPRVTVVSSKPPAPARPSAEAPPPPAAKAAAKRVEATPTPTLVRQAPKSTQDVASKTETRPRAASPEPKAPKEHRTGPATAGTSLASSPGLSTRPEERVIHEPPTPRPSARAAAAPAIQRETVASVLDAPPAAITPQAQPRAQTETTASPQPSVTKELFRRH